MQNCYRLHTPVFMMQIAMGKTKSRIGWFPKTHEKCKVLMKHVGTPRKKNLCTSTPLSPVETVSFSDIAISPLDLPSKQWVMQNHSPNSVIICKVSNHLSSDQQSVTRIIFMVKFSGTTIDNIALCIIFVLPWRTVLTWSADVHQTYLP